MIDYKKIFEEKVNEWQNEQLRIIIVPLSEIKKINNCFINGCFLPYVKENQYDSFEILIDEEITDENKLIVLMHEMGHVKLNDSLGFVEVDKQIKKNRPKWTQFTEFHAYKNQLEEAKKLHDDGIKSILELNVKNILAAKNNPDLINEYKLAIDELLKTELWKECNDLIQNIK